MNEDQRATLKLLPEPGAPRIWRNWLASKGSENPYWISEYPLYSDAWFTAEARDRGPFNILNALAQTTHSGGKHEWKPALILRVAHHLPGEMPDMSVTSAKHYHGGWLPDEVAALLSLELGLRIVAGPEVREFGADNDPLGRPRTYASALLPSLPPRLGPPQMQSLFGTRSLTDVTLFDTLPTLSAAAATTLVKSARTYQQALWIADTTPETAWLLLVSAIEIAAGFWDASRMSPAEKLKHSKPGLVAILQDNTDSDLVSKVAEELHQVIGSTGKFISFSTTFMPEPPPTRPTMERFDFGKRSYRDAITKIYDHRSKALHDGTPFPSPMCHPPRDYGKGEAPWEKPGGLGAASHGASWREEEFPMHLHLFAYIVRGALINWWQSLISD
ncbi:hypothetical protein C8024_18840 [Sphingopyxis sp. BSNA05]|uniref:hypothetical protein n=1 Tax=Sphingomonadales TaxID=204457 RepID=UPI000C1F33AE|nr:MULTISPECIES: hypothetical protein [Sphingomonadaceae]ATW02181.1 hypothetical protein CHN51_00530 [Sphingorhabdus sp. YGSMI21]NRD91066.1 hypothetical protein [Sphingopyxis sp. BSNA05]